jgi:catechol 2,3-dioxygenase-like lactoylglutathione lyase family enzyme
MEHIMPATGPDFISLQVRDLDASQAFYEQYLGLVRSQAGPPHAVVFDTKPIAFALRDLVPGTDLDAVAQPGIGAAIWLRATEVQAIHDALVADGRTIVAEPIDGPFGRTFTFADPDGYQITLHDRG